MITNNSNQKILCKWGMLCNYPDLPGKICLGKNKNKEVEAENVDKSTDTLYVLSMSISIWTKEERLLK